MHHLPKIIRVALLALLVITPWFFGGVWARVQWVLMLVVAILLAVDLVTRFSDDDRPNLVPTAWLPPLLGILLGLFHLVPWPASWAETMAPTTVAWRTELLSDGANQTPSAGDDGASDEAELLDESAAPAEGDEYQASMVEDLGEDADETDVDEAGMGESGATVAESSTRAAIDSLGPVRRSVYPVATREYLALLVLAVGVFVLASAHMMDKQSSLWFFVALAVCGAAMAFFGLIQRLSWNGKFYWVFEPLAGGFQSFGPFVNRNNAGGFLNMCLAAGIGLLIWVHWDPSSKLASALGHEAGERRRDRRSSRSSSSRSASSRSASRSSRPGSSESADHRRSRPAPTRSSGDTPETDRDASHIQPAPSADSSAGQADDAPSSPEITRPRGSDTPLDPSQAESELAKAYRESQERVTDRGLEGEGAERRVSEAAREGSAHHSPSSARSSHRSRRHGESSHSHSDSESHHSRYGMAANPMSYGAGGNKAGAESWQGIQELVRGYMAELDARRLGSLALVGFTAGGVLSTASRGSILAMFVAAMVTIAALAIRQGSRGFAAGLLIMLLAGVGLMNWAGQTEFVKSRFAMMFEQSQYDSGRVPNWIEAMRTFPEFPLAGTGLGTYRFVYERFQERFLRDTIHTHAENQFVQSLVEGGVLGLLLLIVAIVLTGLAIVRLLRTGGPVNTALGVAGTFGLVSQLVGGMFDFGLYIPSNTILMAALCGMVIGRAALLSVWPPEALDSIDQKKNRDQYAAPRANESGIGLGEALSDDRRTVDGKARSRRSSRSRHRSSESGYKLLLGLPAPPMVTTVVVGFLLLGGLFGSLEMNRAARIEQTVRASQLTKLTEAANPDRIAAASAPLRNALPQRWDDAEAHQHLAQLFLLEYQARTYQNLLEQRRAAERQKAEQTAETSADQNADADAATTANGGEMETATSASAESEPEPEPRDDELWSRSSLFHLHATIDQLDERQETDRVAALRAGTMVDEYLRPAARHLLMARASAPTMPQVHYLLAELSAVIPELDDERVHLDRAQQLSPGNATLWYWSGMLHLAAGRADDACATFRRSLELSPLHVDDIMTAAQGKLTVRQILEQTLPPQADMLLHVARKFFSGDERTRYRMVFLQRAEDALDRTDLPPDELAYTTATILNLSGRGREAMTFYEDAISRRSNETRWRYEYALMLVELEEYDKAYEHSYALFQLDKNNGTYKRLHANVISKRVRESK